MSAVLELEAPDLLAEGRASSSGRCSVSPVMAQTGSINESLRAAALPVLAEGIGRQLSGQQVVL